jgi:hypothetical protein
MNMLGLSSSELLSANIKLTLHNALNRSVMNHASPAWEFAAKTYLLKLQRLQNKVPRTVGNFPRCTPVRDMHAAFNLPYTNIQVSQEESSIFWEVTVSAILIKKLYTFTCAIPNGFRDGAISPYSTPYTVQTSNTPCPHTSCKCIDVDGEISENVSY